MTRMKENDWREAHEKIMGLVKKNNSTLDDACRQLAIPTSSYYAARVRFHLPSEGLALKTKRKVPYYPGDKKETTSKPKFVPFVREGEAPDLEEMVTVRFPRGVRLSFPFESDYTCKLLDVLTNPIEPKE